MGRRESARPGEILERTASREERLVVGLSSGTSFDGIDAALVRVRGHGDSISAALVAFSCIAYGESLTSRIASAPGSSAASLARLNFDLGEAFAVAVGEIARAAGVSVADIDLIGSHGQTVFHDPPTQERTGVTLQIGEPDVIAQKTGVVTVADFRTADVAVGGSGAPLVPLVDWLLFREPGEAQLFLNIGGIANVTRVVEDLSGVSGFDTGPGNALIDAIAALGSDRTGAMDEGGERALRGTACVEAVDEFLKHPYFEAPPPKSTGKETFGAEAARELASVVHPGREIEELQESELDDLLATAASVTARSIHAGAAMLPKEPPLTRVVVSGGGVKNRAIMADLVRLFDPCPVTSLSALGMDPDAKEAVAFAVLADRTIAGLPGNVPGATGALRPAVLGKISMGE